MMQKLTNTVEILSPISEQMSLDDLLNKRPPSMINEITWENIFRSSGDPRREIQYGKLPQLVNTGQIDMSICPIELSQAIRFLLNAPFEKCEQFVYLNFGGYHFTHNSSEDHRRLQSIAACFIHECGLEVQFEQWHNGKRVDVASVDGKMLIECGDTTAHVIPEHLLRTCDTFYVLPFMDDWGDPYMFCFTKGEGWDRQGIEDDLTINIDSIRNALNSLDKFTSF